MPNEDNSPFMVQVTAPGAEAAKNLAQSALSKRLAACANILPAVESHYWWRGKLESGGECLVVFKTVGKHLEPLRSLVEREHPYEVPAFVCFRIHSGNPDYLAWIQQECRAQNPLD